MAAAATDGVVDAPSRGVELGRQRRERRLVARREAVEPRHVEHQLRAARLLIEALLDHRTEAGAKRDVGRVVQVLGAHRALVGRAKRHALDVHPAVPRTKVAVVVVAATGAIATAARGGGGGTLPQLQQRRVVVEGVNHRGGGAEELRLRLEQRQLAHAQTHAAVAARLALVQQRHAELGLDPHLALPRHAAPRREAEPAVEARNDRSLREEQVRLRSREAQVNHAKQQRVGEQRDERLGADAQVGQLRVGRQAAVANREARLHAQVDGATERAAIRQPDHQGKERDLQPLEEQHGKQHLPRRHAQQPVHGREAQRRRRAVDLHRAA